MQDLVRGAISNLLPASLPGMFFTQEAAILSAQMDKQSTNDNAAEAVNVEMAELIKTL